MPNYQIEVSFDERQYVTIDRLPAKDRYDAEAQVDGYVQEMYGEEGLHTVKNVQVESIRELTDDAPVTSH